MSIDTSALGQAGQEIGEISVPINYDIIRLFSEGLYRSPHKAVEELVSNRIRRRGAASPRTATGSTRRRDGCHCATVGDRRRPWHGRRRIPPTLARR